MRGRAYRLFRDFQLRCVEQGNAFGLCRLILLARFVPERLTPDVDDAALEERLERAMQTVLATEAAKRTGT